MKIEISFETEHADLFRDEEEKLIVHAVGVELEELEAEIAKFKKSQEPTLAEKLAEPTPETTAEATPEQPTEQDG